MHLLTFHTYRWLLPLLLLPLWGWPGATYAAPAQRAQALAPVVFAPPLTTGAIDNLDEVAQAVVRIEVEGTFVDPQEGRLSGGGRGTGFIIDPSGIAVTNNHVVTGAAILRVYVPGEDQARPAQVLGVNECADLAVIQIEGENFPYLAWSERAIKARMAVEAVGYAFGAEEATITTGTVERVHAEGETDWASLTSVLQHGAKLNPGNSGGPLVDEDGRVVGVNYANNQQTDQYFAISRELAQPIIALLQTGVHQHAIGINGQALTDGETYAGVWVSSVRAGSPADKADILPGDFVVELADQPLAEDGTLKRYCDIVRSNRAKDVVNITVLRDQTLWGGQLNGEKLQPLTPLTPTPAPTPVVDGYQFAEVANDAIHALLPVEWADTRLEDWVVNGAVIGQAFHASPDLSQGWSAPGISVYSASNWPGDLDLEKALAVGEVADRCTFDRRHTDEHSAGGFTYRGAHDVWLCSDEQESYDAYVRLAVESEPRGQVVIISFRGLTEADAEAWGKLINSFYVAGTVQPTPTPAADPLAAIKQQSPIFADDFTFDSGRMNDESDADVEYSYQQAGLNIRVKPAKLLGWSPTDVTLGNILAETEISLLDGPADMNYGLIFRLVDNQNFYQFSVNLLGEYSLWKVQNDEWTTLAKWTKSSVIATGRTARNRLAVLAQGAQITLLVNGQILAQIEDATFDRGQIGLAVETFDEGNAQVTFRQLRIWNTSHATGESTPTPVATPTPAPQAFAVVKIAKLNIRSGPGTNYGAIGSVSQNDRLLVIGRADNSCSWLQVQLADGKIGWIAGPPTYSELIGNCNELVVVPTPPPPPLPAKPCVRFDNHFNKVADVTLTMPDNGNWNHKFNIAPHQRSTQCLAPGRYTFSVGVPGEGSINGEFTLVRGGRLQVIPIYKEFK